MPVSKSRLLWPTAATDDDGGRRGNGGMLLNVEDDGRGARQLADNSRQRRVRLRHLSQAPGPRHHPPDALSVSASTTLFRAIRIASQPQKYYLLLFSFFFFKPLLLEAVSREMWTSAGQAPTTHLPVLAIKCAWLTQPD